MQLRVVVIGAGVVGCSVARELSKYELDVVLLEKSEDIGGDASRGNSAMMVCGYDTPQNSLETKLVRASNAMMDGLFGELDVEFDRIGAIQVAKTPDEIPALHESYRQAKQNGISDAVMLGKEELLAMEPHISKSVREGMLIPREGRVDVFELVIAYAENAAENGVKIMTSTEVTGLIREDGRIKTVVTNRGNIHAGFVINAAGVLGDTIGRMAGIDDYHNYPRYGQFHVLDKNLPYAPNHMIMPVPTPVTRGKLILPAMHGNLLLGPTATDGEDKADKTTDRETLEAIIKETRELIPAIDPKDAITQFTGIRPARSPKGDYVNIYEEIKGYVEVSVASTGVSTSPAIGEYVSHRLADAGLELVPKKNFNKYRAGIRRFAKMSEEERDEIIKENPGYGHVICRCETVTEGEILEAINRDPPPRSMDGIKRRLRTGMGRCQGGFCGPRLVEILAREFGVDASEIRKNEEGSELLVGKNRV